MSTLNDIGQEKGVGVQIPPSAPNLPDHIDSYLSELLLLRKPSTENRARQILFEAIPFLDGNTPRVGVLAYLKACKDKGNDNRTLEGKRIRLASFFKHAGIKLAVPIPKIHYTLRKPEVYTQPELNAILNTAQLRFDRDYWLYKTLLQSGLRFQEAQHLEYSDLLDSGIRVTKHGDWSPKDHEERRISVPRSLIEGLRLLPREGGGLVFPSRRGGLDFHMLRKLKVCAAAAGVDPTKAWLHKFRANFATTLLRAGISLPDLMHAMGHSSVTSTQRYLALLEGQDMQQKVEAIWQ